MMLLDQLFHLDTEYDTGCLRCPQRPEYPEVKLQLRGAPV